jgi:hypothetical protein
MQYVHYNFLFCKEVTNDTEMCKREKPCERQGHYLTPEVESTLQSVVDYEIMIKIKSLKV